jgi:hypothetical protein
VHVQTAANHVGTARDRDHLFDPVVRGYVIAIDEQE